MINQIELVCAIWAELDRQGIKTLSPRKMNACINAANEIITEVESPDRPSVPGMGLDAWLKSDDTGASSCYLASALCGFVRTPAAPLDADDFGRCYRMLRAVPEAQAKLDRQDLTAHMGAEWANLLAAWADLEKEYEAGTLTTERLDAIKNPTKGPT